MKNLILAFLILASSAPARADQPPAESLLNAAETALLLKELDNICGDTWCEGVYKYEFTKIQCLEGDGYCSLHFTVLDQGLDDDGEVVVYNSAPWSCGIAPFLTKADIITAEGSYTQQLFDAVSGCIDMVDVDF